MGSSVLQTRSELLCYIVAIKIDGVFSVTDQVGTVVLYRCDQDRSGPQCYRSGYATERAATVVCQIGSPVE